MPDNDTPHTGPELARLFPNLADEQPVADHAADLLNASRVLRHVIAVSPFLEPTHRKHYAQALSRMMLEIAGQLRRAS